MWRAPEGPEGMAAVPVGGGRACPGIKMTLGADQYARPHWCEGQRRGLAGHISDTAPKRRRCGGSGGPGCGARGRRRGLAGLRDDAPSEARGADGSRAGRRPRAHTAARPHKAAHRSAQNTSGATATHHRNTTPGIQKTDIRIGCRPLVELGGFEPPTFSLRTRRATNCAIAPRTQTA